MATQPSTPPRPALRVVLATDRDARRAITTSAVEFGKAATDTAEALAVAWRDTRPAVLRLAEAGRAVVRAYVAARGDRS